MFPEKIIFQKKRDATIRWINYGLRVSGKKDPGQVIDQGFCY
jgi:hypothetical protein